MTSSPFRPGSTVEDQLSYYKAQYEQLESELSEFQASSRELEAELEKDVEASEKRERKLKEQVEMLGFEVDEWKTKCKQSKDEANRAQNTLQKEITAMRESNRAMQMKLRDIEVANDDYERQARHTTSSLEDLEAKQNMAIERGVMLEEEIRMSEQEREHLRIETQRLRDELSDLRIENEITTEKLRHSEAAIERLHSRRAPPMHANPARPLSRMSAASATTPPSPTISTPPAGKSEASSSDAPTPPSPPLSDAPATMKPLPKTPGLTKRRSLIPDSNITPRPNLLGTRMPRHSRGPSITSAGTSATGASQRMGPPPSRPGHNAAEGLPRSESLYQIKGLIGRMQKIEERVHSVRSKLPPTTRTTPRNSPRAGSGLDHHIPASVTVRGSRRSSRYSTAISAKPDDKAEDIKSATGRMSRLSFGVPASSAPERPTSSASRPSSRASNASQPTDANPFIRPSSRLSIGGARTPLGHYPTNGADRRPRSSLGGNYAGTPASRNGHSAIASDVHDSDTAVATPTTARRTTMDKRGIPTPSALPRRQSGGIATQNMLSRRTSHGLDRPLNEGSMAPPPDRLKKRSDVGETF